MRPDYYEEDDSPWKKKKSKSTEKKLKKSKKNTDKHKFRNYVQDFLDKRDDKEYDIDKE